jgi:hypothetical protein
MFNFESSMTEFEWGAVVLILATLFGVWAATCLHNWRRRRAGRDDRKTDENPSTAK